MCSGTLVPGCPLLSPVTGGGSVREEERKSDLYNDLAAAVDSLESSWGRISVRDKTLSCGVRKDLRCMATDRWLFGALDGASPFHIPHQRVACQHQIQATAVVAQQREKDLHSTSKKQAAVELSQTCRRNKTPSISFLMATLSLLSHRNAMDEDFEFDIFNEALLVLPSPFKMMELERFPGNTNKRQRVNGRRDTRVATRLRGGR